MPRLTILLVALAVALSGCGGDDKSSSSNPTTTTTAAADPGQAELPGAQTGPPPWTRGVDQLEQRLQVLGLPALPSEAFVVHIHQHLDVYIEGRHLVVPAGIGIGETFISPLHTHDVSGVIHVESDRPRTFTLGEFFGVWGVPLSSSKIGGLDAGGGKQVRAWVNGNRFSGDPSTIELTSHEEIVVAYGTPAQTPKPVPATFGFPPGE
jgi:hypothetical protein